MVDACAAVNRVCEIVKTQLALPDGSVAAPDKFSALGADSIDTGYTNIESEIDASNRARLEKMVQFFGSDFRIELSLGLLCFEWSGRIPPEGFTMQNPRRSTEFVKLLKTQLALPDGSVAAPDKFSALGADSIDTKMSPEEIAHTQAEIMKNMDPALKKILQEKEQDKTRKNSFISPNSSISSTSLLTCTPIVEKARRRLRLYEEKSVSNFKFHPSASDKGLPITSTRSTKTKEDVFLITEAAKGDGGFLLILIRKGSCLCMMNVLSFMADKKALVHFVQRATDRRRTVIVVCFYFNLSSYRGGRASCFVVCFSYLGLLYCGKTHESSYRFGLTLPMPAPPILS
ncbi:acyl carrier protein 1, chloroplastic-like protein [Tanacetum coccineum]